MKVAIDARMIKMSGIGTYIQNLMKNNIYDIALGNEDDIKDYSNNVEVIEYDSKIYGIKEQLKFPYKKLRQLKPDILHVPHYNIPIFYRGKMIVTIHDLTHLVLPEFLPNKFAKFYAKFMIGLACKKAFKILTVSENTKKDIIKMFNVNPDKIVVIYNGVGKEFVKKNKSDISYLYKKYNIPKDKKLLMYVGNLKPHKNLNRLLQSFSKLDDKEKYRLLLVGKSFENQIDLQEIEKDLDIEKYIIHTGLISQDELVDFYNLANLVVFPSLYEGFGLPVIESLACGTNVIASNNSSIPEVGGNVIDYFDPYDIDDIKNKIEKNIDKGFNYSVTKWLEKFDWEKNAKIVKKVIKGDFK